MGIGSDRLRRLVVASMINFKNIKLNSKISVDQAVNYNGQAILLLIDPKVGLGDGFSFATFAGEDASSVIIATTPASFSSASLISALLIRLPSSGISAISMSVSSVRIVID